jgi:predicted ATP-grasp superfamily ATP-dependent carboligase
VNDNNKRILSIDLDGIELGSSKFACYNYFKESSVNTPQSYIIPLRNETLDKDFIIQKYYQLNCPIIVKPDDGVGAENIFYFNSEEQIHSFFTSRSNLIDSKRDYILQEFIEGEDLSISLIAHKDLSDKFDKNHLILAINSQDINIKKLNGNSEYFGGYTPVVDLNKKISNILEKLDLSKFNGYFGIDLIRKEDNSIYFIEINPRLTTSYIGVRKILNYNPVEVITYSKFPLLESKEPRSNMNSLFKRVELKYVGTESPEKMRKEIIPLLVEEIPEVVTPPISFFSPDDKQIRQYSCFIATRERNLDASKNRLTKIMKTFENFNLKKLN